MPENITLLEFCVFATFFGSFAAMAAGSLFFFAERGSVPVKHRATMTVSGLILFVAAVNYFYMQNIYWNSVTAGETVYPIAYRYIDWIITTPLMLIKFPLLLGLGRRGRTFLIRLVGLDIVMILSGFFGELMDSDPMLHFALFGLGILCWIGILYLLLSATSNLPDRFPEYIRKGIKTMVIFVLVGWSIYPLGYILPSVGLTEEARAFVYNIGDIVNKVGLALIVYGIVLKSKEDEEDADHASA